jgi:hypothetical protein
VLPGCYTAVHGGQLPRLVAETFETANPSQTCSRKTRCNSSMGELNLTEPERDYIERIARDRHGVAGRVRFYMAVLTLMLLFAAYAVLTQDFIAEFLTFLGVFLFVLWRASQELGLFKVGQSALQKVADHGQQGRSTRHATTPVNCSHIWRHRGFALLPKWRAVDEQIALGYGIGLSRRGLQQVR